MPSSSGFTENASGVTDRFAPFINYLSKELGTKVVLRVANDYAAVIEEIVRAKPSAAKGRYIRSVTLTTTMGPGVRVDPNRVKIDEHAGSTAG